MKHEGVSAADVIAPRERRAFAYVHVVSLQETNLVGNVYFAEFASWQGRCRELFLRDHAPDVLEMLKDRLKLVTTRLQIEYAAELFAFDEVEINMRLVSIQGARIRMGFEYRVSRGGVQVTAAVGEQEVACLTDGQLAAPPASLARALAAFGG